MVSYRPDDEKLVKFLIVLILVVVDDGLVRLQMVMVWHSWVVLILVVVEDGLVLRSQLRNQLRRMS